MKVLVTGGAGFVAGHLRNELTAAGHEVALSDVVPADLPSFITVDLTDAAAVRELVAEVRPDAVVHLGAISFVPDAAKQPELLECVNVGGTVNLVNAMVAEVPRSKLLFVSTAQVLLPMLSAYARSKLAAEREISRIAEKSGLWYMIARPANHTGPGQSSKFVVPSFIAKVKAMRDGKCDCFTVGNLESTRTFTDVRDIVSAYRILIEKGDWGKVYPVDAGERFSIRAVLEIISRLIGIGDPRIKIDQTLWRPTDHTPELDTSAIRAMGWSPRFRFVDTVQDMLA